MVATNDKIIVKVNPNEKNSTIIGDSKFLLAKEYNTNYRERNPVVCEVIKGNGKLKDGSFILVHHNSFSEHSPHYLGDNLYSLAYNKSIFCRLDEQGNAHSMCGNIVVENILVEWVAVEVAAFYQKHYTNRAKVVSNGYGFKKDDILLFWDMGNYEIIYNWKGEERRVVKVFKDDIVGVLKKQN
jgi:hypothetical protein